MAEPRWLIVVVRQEQPHNSTLTVYARGRRLGTVLEDRPGWWTVTPPAAAEQHPTLEAAVGWLLDRAALGGSAAGGSAAPGEPVGEETRG